MFEYNNEMNAPLIAYQEDGLVDIFIGLGIFCAGLFIRTELAWMVAIFVPTFLPAFQAARKRYLKPRMNESDHGTQQQVQSQKNVLFITFMLGLLLFAGLAMFYGFGMLTGPVNDWIRHYFLLILGGVFASVWGLAAIIMKQRRYFLHALATLVPMVVAHYTNLPFWMALSLIGGLILLVGLGVFIHFLQTNPIQKQP